MARRSKQVRGMDEKTWAEITAEAIRREITIANLIELLWRWRPNHMGLPQPTSGAHVLEITPPVAEPVVDWRDLLLERDGRP